MGRTLPLLKLSEPERREFEGLAGRRKTAQALAQRARIVLLAAAGHTSKDVAAQLSVDPATVGKWRRRQVASPVPRRADGWPARRAALGRTTHRRRRPGRSGADADSREPVRGCHALEFARHGQGQRRVDLERSAHLARLRAAAAPGRDLQALHRPTLRREGPGYRRPLHGPSRQCRRSVRRREEPDPGARAPPGSIRSSASSPCSPSVRSAAAFIAAWPIWRPPSQRSSTLTMHSPHPSDGRSPPAISSLPSSGSVCEPLRKKHNLLNF